MSDIRYSVKRCGKWLQGIEANSNYVCGACAPTMGARHTLTEYRTVWGKEQKFFERLTLLGYLGTLFEEYRWEEKKYTEIKVVPSAGGCK